jgi:protease-4
MHRASLPPRSVQALLLALLLALLAGCTSFASLSRPEFREVLLQGEGRDKMLLIDISEPIANTPLVIPQFGVIPGLTGRVRQELELAYIDPNIRGIMLRIDSGGGGLTDSDVIYHALMEFKKTKNVKIIAAMGDIAASGALYVAMAADEIYAHPTTITGSIGVILPHIEYAGLLDKLGIKADPIVTGKYKDIDSPFRPRTKEEGEMLQAIIDQQFEKFIQVIQAGRKRMSAEQIRAIADGRLLTAQQAQQRGLIDGVGYLDDIYKRLGEITGFRKNRLVRYSNAWMTGNNIYTNTFPIEVIQE